MLFNELNEENFLIFAIKNYENPQAVTREDFDKDLSRFRYIKRLLKRYKTTGDLKVHLLVNHFIILLQISLVMQTTPMLFYKIDKNLWSAIKSFVVFLNRLPDYPQTYIHEIELDQTCLDALNGITNG